MERLRALLRDFSERVQDLDERGELLDAVPELMKRLGELRSELFHYEVRSTYDTPEVAENRRIVEDAKQPPETFRAEPDDDEPWRRPDPSEPT